MAATRRRKLVPRHEMIPSLPRNDSVIAASRLALATSGHAFHVLNIARFGAMGIGGATKDHWMIVSTAYRRPAGFAAAALCSLALIALATPAAARPHHGAHRHHHSHVHHAHHARHYARNAPCISRPPLCAARLRCSELRGCWLPAPELWRRLRRVGPGRGGAALHRRQSHRPQPAVVRALHEHGADALRSSRHGIGHGALVRELRPAHSGPQVGAIAGCPRGRRGGHVGIVSGFVRTATRCDLGKSRRRCRGGLPRSRVYAYVMPPTYADGLRRLSPRRPYLG